jgi:hypothetical protein
MTLYLLKVLEAGGVVNSTAATELAVDWSVHTPTLHLSLDDHCTQAPARIVVVNNYIGP